MTSCVISRGIERLSHGTTSLIVTIKTRAVTAGHAGRSWNTVGHALLHVGKLELSNGARCKLLESNGFLKMNLVRHSLGILQEILPESCERLSQSFARGSLRTLREILSEACKRYSQNFARYFLRISQEILSEHCKKFSQNLGKDSLKLLRKILSRLYERSFQNFDSLRIL